MKKKFLVFYTMKNYNRDWPLAMKQNLLIRIIDEKLNTFQMNVAQNKYLLSAEQMGLYSLFDYYTLIKT